LTAIATDDLCARILARDRRALARAASLIEARTGAGLAISKKLFAHTGRALVIGITGPSGAGKSTLVNQLTKHLRLEGKRVGILAVDPSSPFTQGAILGDRIRMQDHHADPEVFIRSTANRGKLGGLAATTLELTLLLDAAGMDVILVESVGVGQGEVDIARLADLTAVVLVPGLGDDVQAIKAGIMEVADVFVINKADRPGAEQLEQEIRAMQTLGSGSETKQPAPIYKVSASTGQGIDELLRALRSNAESRARRTGLSESWKLRLTELVREQLLAFLDERVLETHAERVAERTEDPFTAADQISKDLLARLR
jgi:LAO/AO transport system kinase